jgi:UDP-GlcNAc:undecaprenyl-phosphate GlcNAc-1-phosphate transferase
MAFCGALALLSALTVRAMIGVGVMDRPDPRKAHATPIPKSGGVGIVVAFLVGIAILYRYAEFSRLADAYFVGVIVAAAAIAVVALLDDIWDWPFVVKLGAQVLAALAAVVTGITVSVVHLPYLGTIDFGWLGVPATLGWILFATNAMNFIDGMDGLAGGVALIASGFLAAIAAAHGVWFGYFAALLLAAGLVGFLPFNFPHARIFMGDVGSQFCGFMLAMLGVVAGRLESVELSLLLVPMLLCGVLFDVAFTLARRALAGRRVTQPHRDHLYQIAQRSGMDARRVTAIYWGFTGFAGLCCLAFIAAPGDAKLVLAVLPLAPPLIWAGVVLRRAHARGVAT